MWCDVLWGWKGGSEDTIVPICRRTAPHQSHLRTRSLKQNFQRNPKFQLSQFETKLYNQDKRVNNCRYFVGKYLHFHLAGKGIARFFSLLLHLTCLDMQWCIPFCRYNKRFNIEIRFRAGKNMLKYFGRKASRSVSSSFSWSFVLLTKQCWCRAEQSRQQNIVISTDPWYRSTLKMWIYCKQRCLGTWHIWAV